jgi:hypothetical protein
VVTQAGPAEATNAPKAPKRKKPSTARDMLLSLAVVGAAIAIFVLLLPKTPHQKVHPVEYLPAAQSLARDAKLPVLVPQPLPPGWQANYVRLSGAPEAIHVGFVLDAKRFARLDESASPDAAFYKSSFVPETKSNEPGDVGIAGFEVRRAGGHVALVKQLAAGAVLTISDGGTSTGASLPELVSLAKSLREQTS